MWGDDVKNRSKRITIAIQTSWRELQKLAAINGVSHLGDVTPELMRKFVDEMSARGLAVFILNERLAKIKSFFKVAKAKGALAVNPAVDTIGMMQNSFEKRKKQRLV